MYDTSAHDIETRLPSHYEVVHAGIAHNFGAGKEGPATRMGLPLTANRTTPKMEQLFEVRGTALLLLNECSYVRMPVCNTKMNKVEFNTSQMMILSP